eukprot:3036486-Pyramimonas_sp.AAC.1
MVSSASSRSNAFSVTLGWFLYVCRSFRGCGVAGLNMWKYFSAAAPGHVSAVGLPANIPRLANKVNECRLLPYSFAVFLP